MEKEPTLGDYIELRRDSDVLYDIQEARKRVESRTRKMPKTKLAVVRMKDKETGIELTYTQSEIFRLQEDAMTKKIEGKLKMIPIWTEFLSKVRGVGPRLVGYVIGKTMVRFVPVSKENLLNYSIFQQELAQETRDGKYLVPTRRGIEAFDNISKFWAFWGLAVRDGEAQRRKKGEKADYNPVNLSTAWKIGGQFVRQGVRYRAEYDRYKMRITAQRTPPEKCPQYGVNRWCKAKIKEEKKPTCKSHIHNMSKRYAVKQFFKDLWIAWRILEDLPVSEAYVVDVLGHEKK